MRARLRFLGEATSKSRLKKFSEFMDQLSAVRQMRNYWRFDSTMMVTKNKKITVAQNAHGSPRN